MPCQPGLICIFTISNLNQGLVSQVNVYLTHDKLRRFIHSETEIAG
jgi:hypothetical protein